MKKTTRNISLFILLISFFTIGCIYIYNQITYGSRFAQNWNKMKGDFEIINGLAIDYFEKNNFNTIVDYKFKKTLNQQQLATFERAENNYRKYGGYGGHITHIEFHDGIIEYYDFENYGQFEKIVYSKHNKRQLRKLYNKGEHHFIIEELGDNWYYLYEHHL